MKEEPKLVPFDRIEDFGGAPALWVHEEKSGADFCIGIRTEKTGLLVIRDCDGERWTMTELNSHGFRWSTSPTTPWEDCKPFTKEAKP